MPCEPRVDRDGFCCPGSSFRLFWDNRTDFAVPVRHFASFWATGTESHSPDALSCDGRRRGMAEFRGFGFAYIGCSWKGLSRFAKRGRNPEPGQPNLSRFVCRSIDPATGTSTAHRQDASMPGGMTISDDTRFSCVSPRPPPQVSAKMAFLAVWSAVACGKS